MSILEKIRQKDDRQKKIFSFVSAFVLTLIILVVWLSFSKRSDDNLVLGKAENKLSSVSPLQMIKDEFSEAFAGFNEFGEEVVPVEVLIENEEISSSTATSTATSTDSTDTSTTTEEINQ